MIFWVLNMLPAQQPQTGAGGVPGKGMEVPIEVRLSCHGSLTVPLRMKAMPLIPRMRVTITSIASAIDGSPLQMEINSACSTL